MNTYTVQHTQFGVIETNDYQSEDAAREAFAAVIADTDTTEAWIFDGPSQNANAIEQFTRSQNKCQHGLNRYECGPCAVMSEVK